MTGIELIAIERSRQIKDEKWTAEHDDEHNDNSLAFAAACYALGAPHVHVERQLNSDRGLEGVYSYSKPQPAQISWPWAAEWYKPGDGSNSSRVRRLIKAGALIAAEIDRLQRHFGGQICQPNQKHEQE